MSTHKLDVFCDIMLSMSVKDILAANLKKLMDSDARLRTCDAVGQRSGVSRSTINRVTRGSGGVSVDHAEEIAQAFKLELWQLLSPNLDPQAPPVLSTGDQNVMRLARIIASLDESQQAQVIGFVSGVKVNQGLRPNIAIDDNSTIQQSLISDRSERGGAGLLCEAKARKAG